MSNKFLKPNGKLDWEKIQSILDKHGFVGHYYGNFKDRIEIQKNVGPYLSCEHGVLMLDDIDKLGEIYKYEAIAIHESIPPHALGGGNRIIRERKICSMHPFPKEAFDMETKDRKLLSGRTYLYVGESETKEVKI